VIRVRAGQRPFMRKNLPDYAPPWIQAISMRAESSHREVRYARCEDKPALIWLASQRAVEYHVTLGTAGHLDRPSCLVPGIGPPAAGESGRAAAAARPVREALSGAGLAGAVKTGGARGVHVCVPVQEPVSADDAAAATRALVGAPVNS
jgi:bifunctional non-homologous end joining protein LigD